MENKHDSTQANTIATIMLTTNDDRSVIDASADKTLANCKDAI